MTSRRDGLVRVIIPDSHGSKIDPGARAAFLGDLKHLCPDEIVMLGDHVDCDGLWSKHAPTALEDKEYSYYEDIDAAASFLDEIQKLAPKAEIHYIEGNHEYHVERWAAEKLSAKDAKKFCDDNAPYAKLKLKKRGIHFYRQMQSYQNLSIPNTIKLGNCYFTHGFSCAKYATGVMLEAFGASMVHGHTHRKQAVYTRSVEKSARGAWCPGTLMILQPTYQHTKPSNWTHGYDVQFEAPSKLFQHVGVTIAKGVSLLQPLLSRFS